MTNAIAVPPEIRAELEGLVEESRATCLWYLRSDYFPESPAEIERTLLAIENHGDRATFSRARRLRRWFSHDSSAKSAIS